MKNSENLAIAILAAGQGKRMRNPNFPKVLFPINGKPLLGYVLDTALKIHPKLIFVIVGYKKDMVIEFISKNYFTHKICIIEQTEQLGTANAVLHLEGYVPDDIKYLLILSGDVPFVTMQTLQNFVENHIERGYDLSLITTNVADPTGYGRIVRDENGNIYDIIEHKDLPEEMMHISEINSGIYCINVEKLFVALKMIQNLNAQKEYYLTDLVRIYLDMGLEIFAFKSDNPLEFLGVNTPEDLKMLEKSGCSN